MTTLLISVNGKVVYSSNIFAQLLVGRDDQEALTELTKLGLAQDTVITVPISASGSSYQDQVTIRTLKSVLSFNLFPNTLTKDKSIPELTAKLKSNSESIPEDVNAGDILTQGLNRLANPVHRNRGKDLFDEAAKFRGILTKPNQTDSNSPTESDHIEWDNPYGPTKPKP